MSNFVNLLDIIYPIGSIYIATNDADPADIVGGIWVEQTNYFIPLLNTWGHTYGLNQNTIGDITLLIGFSNISLSNYSPWAQGTSQLRANIISDNTTNLGVFGFSQAVKPFIWYQDVQNTGSYENKTDSNTNNWQAIIGIGKAKDIVKAPIKFYKRTA
jgi:hypothetical protein